MPPPMTYQKAVGIDQTPVEDTGERVNLTVGDMECPSVDVA